MWRKRGLKKKNIDIVLNANSMQKYYITNINANSIFVSWLVK